jgi:hypothetical protein
MGRVIAARSSSAIASDLDARNSDCVLGIEPELTTATQSLCQARARDALPRCAPFFRTPSVLRGACARGMIIQGLAIQGLAIQGFAIQGLAIQGLAIQGLPERPGRDDPEAVNLTVIHHNPIRTWAEV